MVMALAILVVALATDIKDGIGSRLVA